MSFVLLLRKGLNTDELLLEFTKFIKIIMGEVWASYYWINKLNCHRKYGSLQNLSRELH